MAIDRVSLAWMLFVVLFAAPVFAEPTEELPRVYTWSPQLVAEGRARALKRDAELLPAVEALRARAETAMREPIVRVTDKPVTHHAPTGDPRDYTSVSVYYWPDLNDPKAPWIRTDGRRNEDAVAKFDGARLARMCDRVVTLAQAGYFTGDSRFSTAAAHQVRAWFTDPQTRMNPHMEYAQFVPNQSKGTPWGIIDANRLPDVLDAIGLLDASGAWTAEDHAAMQAWCRAFSQWLVESPNGRRERDMDNNHAVFYDLMLASLAMFCDDQALAQRVLEGVGHRRIPSQIAPDGSLPHELKRPDAAMYAAWTTSGYLSLARLGEQVGVDLWSVETADGRSLRKAVEWWVPYVTGQKQWAYGKPGSFSPRGLHDVFYHASQAYDDGLFEQVLVEHILPTIPAEEHQRALVRLLAPVRVGVASARTGSLE